MSPVPMQSNGFRSLVDVVSASHDIGGKPKDRHMGLGGVLTGIDANGPGPYPDMAFARLDTNGKLLRDWDD